MKAALPTREEERLAVLRDYKILDTPSEEAYDDITALAAFICGVPIALISLVDADRQWFKSKVGIDISETKRDVSICAHAILNQGITVIRDTREDPRFASNPLVTLTPAIRFYAGVPLRAADNHPIGTLCVIDHQPRDLSDAQIRTLEALARQVVLQLELRRSSALLADALDRIRLIEGLIPICSYCKSIRNDQGYWSTVEKFIQEHSEVQFTHGVCDSCMEKHFPEVARVLLGSNE